MELIDIDAVMAPHCVVPIKGDEMCFFYSLSYFMFRTDLQAPQVKVSVVQHICNNWQRFQEFTMMLCGNIYRTMVEYQGHMSLRTTYTTHCEIKAADEIYPYHLVVYRDGKMIVKFGEPVEGTPILRFRYSGSMMSSHFEPLIRICYSSSTTTCCGSPYPYIYYM